MSVEKRAHAASGWAMLLVVVAGYIVSLLLLVMSFINFIMWDEWYRPGPSPFPLMLLGFVLLVATSIARRGFFTLQPGQARVCVLFGKYVGTVRDDGLKWANPFYAKSLGRSSAAGATTTEAAGTAVHRHDSKISVRARTYTGERIKVNDKMGNPIEIATVIVWHVADTAKALFDVDDYESYVEMITETALRHVASLYSYDHMEDAIPTPALLPCVPTSRKSPRPSRQSLTAS